MGKVFLNTVEQTILEHIEDENFGVTELVFELGLSKSQVLRKVKSASGKTISEFIKEVRLKEAYKLLRETELTASEISYRVGFNSPSYFNKCFHDFYGCTPGNFDMIKADITENDKEISQESKTLLGIKKKSWFYIVTVSLLIIAVSLLLINRQVDSKKDTKLSVAILPFKNLSEDKDNQYFADGVMDDILSHLSSIKELKVISRTTMEQYRNTTKTSPEISKELKINFIVESSIQKQQDSIKITTQLIDAKKDKHLWSKIFIKEYTNIFALESEIAKQIASELKITITPEELEQIDKIPTSNLKAYETLMKGKFYWEKLDMRSIEKALKYFQLASELDPEWADPYAELANAWGLFSFFGYLPKSVTLPKVYKYLDKALELDPNSAQAHYVNALLAVWTEWDWEKGEKEFLRSLELDPNNSLTRLYYAHLLMIIRRKDEAIHQAQIGLYLDPLKPLVLGLYGVVMAHTGNRLSANQYFEKALSIDPDFGFASYNLLDNKLSLTYLHKDYDQWIKLWGDKVKGGWIEEGRVRVLDVYAEKGHIAAIEEMFRMNKKYGNEGCGMRNHIKRKRYFKLGDYEKVIDFIEKDYEVKDSNMPYVLSDPVYFNQFKNNPRYVELLRKMNLPLPD